MKNNYEIFSLMFIDWYFLSNNAELYLFNQAITSVFIAGTILGGLSRVAEKTDNYKRSSQLTVYVDKKAANVNTRFYLFKLFK
jgi:hypothetical protein